MVSDEDLVRRLTEVLETADLATTTTGAIRRQLESELHIDLSNRKAFIREQVDLFLQSRQPVVEAEEEPAAQDEYGDQREDGEDGEEEEEEAEDEDGSCPDTDEPEPDSSRLRAKINRAIKDSLPKEKKKRAVGGGLSKLCTLSPELQVVIGETELPRTQVVKQLWAYIRANNLQDPSNKRKILCDDPLRRVFGTETTDMFKMNKVLSKHLWPHDGSEGATEAEPKQKKQKVEKTEKKEGVKEKSTGFLAPLPLSDSLKQFLGTGESELSRSEVVKRIWDYIKSKQLQDPADKRRIVCDSKLQQLFDCKTFIGFSMTKLLSPHLRKS